MKVARAEAEFAELKGNNVVVARGAASRADLAAARAVRNLFADPKVKRKRISNFRVNIFVTEEPTVETIIS